MVPSGTWCGGEQASGSRASLRAGIGQRQYRGDAVAEHLIGAGAGRLAEEPLTPSQCHHHKAGLLLGGDRRDLIGRMSHTHDGGGAYIPQARADRVECGLGPDALPVQVRIDVGREPGRRRGHGHDMDQQQVRAEPAGHVRRPPYVVQGARPEFDGGHDRLTRPGCRNSRAMRWQRVGRRYREHRDASLPQELRRGRTKKEASGAVQSLGAHHDGVMTSAFRDAQNLACRFAECRGVAG